jgi:hypothetical protein
MRLGCGEALSERALAAWFGDPRKGDHIEARSAARPDVDRYGATAVTAHRDRCRRPIACGRDSQPGILSYYRIRCNRCRQRDRNSKALAMAIILQELTS